MVNLKFSPFLLTFTFSLFVTFCVCESNSSSSCTIQDTIATCESNEDFKSLQQQEEAANISKLIVRSEKLKRINKDDFTLFVNLEEIDLANCALEEIDENAFVDLPKLHKINLGGNTKLKIANDKSFISSDTVTCLNLSNTEVADGISETFTHLPQLVNLDLSGTNIKDFTFLESLEHLNKLVISKSNTTLDLCNLVHVKDVIEKDENGTEVTLDCKAKKDESIPEEVTTEKEATTKEVKSETPEIKTEEAEITTTVIAKKLEDEEETTTVTPPKTDEPKIIETTEISTKPEVEAKPEEPKLIHESSEETTTLAVSTTKEDEATTIEVQTEPTIKHEATTNAKLDENMNKTGNLRAAPNMKVANENPQVVLESSDDVILPSTANTSGSNGVNIVLGIILCVMVVGAIGFGFKYWKNRRSGYTHANTHDQHENEDKELQTIVAHRVEPEQN